MEDDDVGLILPGTVAYAVALTEIPPVPTWRAEAGQEKTYMICRAGQQGLMESVTYKEWADYVYGGELDERQEEIDTLDDELEGLILAA
ncbi:hypothetical protein [Leptolyngbya sp. KIOST-1]|uniref:hypothetical protein n=1 Tax=Leptolyngbya sp. KIOST-1 TaxID=1229172 RepID=UPI000AB8E552|nr:hypothetical protein [Leptolyngbya sp. KIOST-1]